MKDNEELKQHKFIVFCGDHYNPLGVIRSLGEKKIRPIVILVAKEPKLVPASRYIGKLHHADDIEDGLRILLNLYGNEKEKPFVYTCSDEIASLLDLNYNRLIDKFFFFHGKEQGIVTHYLNKKNISDLAVAKGCKALRYEVVKQGQLPENLCYPVITKAINSTLYNWKGDSFICNDEKELLEAYKEIRSEKILVQEFIHKKNEYCVDGFSYNGGENVEITYVANYLRFSDISYGGYMVLHPIDRPEVYEQLKNMIREIGFDGIFCAEFLIDEEDELYFLEINLRNSGWSYSSTYGGYNMPYLWAKACIEKNIDMSLIKHEEKLIAMAEQEDFQMAVKEQKMGVLSWMKDFITADCHYFSNWKDPLPFAAFLTGYFIRRIRRIFVKDKSSL